MSSPLPPDQNLGQRKQSVFVSILSPFRSNIYIQREEEEIDALLIEHKEQFWIGTLHTFPFGFQSKRFMHAP